MQSHFARLKCVWASSLALFVALGVQAAQAADLGYAPPRAYASSPAYASPPPVYFLGVDRRCQIVPMPQLDLVGDTARFRATAVCQSRGLYADSLYFPEPPLVYRGYSYGRER